MRWWADKCIEWCFAVNEKNRFGDQMYLDFFHEKFEGVHDLEHLGGGVAPWNVSQYSFFEREGKIFLQERATGSKAPLVFYHFHSLSFFNKDVVHFADNMYCLPDTALVFVYKKYIRYTEQICRTYQLKEGIWRNECVFRDDDMDRLDHKKNYYQYSLFC